jgi:hypothetical protein
MFGMLWHEILRLVSLFIYADYALLWTKFSIPLLNVTIIYLCFCLIHTLAAESVYVELFSSVITEVFITVWQWFLLTDLVLYIIFIPKKSMFNYACLHLYNAWKAVWKCKLAEDLNIHDSEQSLFSSDGESSSSVDNSVLDFKGWRVVWVMGNIRL